MTTHLLKEVVGLYAGVALQGAGTGQESLSRSVYHPPKDMVGVRPCFGEGWKIAVMDVMDESEKRYGPAKDAWSLSNWPYPDIPTDKRSGIVVCER
jgi:hypothetical protein